MPEEDGEFNYTDDATAAAPARAAVGGGGSAAESHHGAEKRKLADLDPDGHGGLAFLQEGGYEADSGPVHDDGDADMAWMDAPLAAAAAAPARGAVGGGGSAAESHRGAQKRELAALGPDAVAAAMTTLGLLGAPTSEIEVHNAWDRVQQAARDAFEAEPVPADIDVANARAIVLLVYRGSRAAGAKSVK